MCRNGARLLPVAVLAGRTGTCTVFRTDNRHVAARVPKRVVDEFSPT
jgi:hypothetical protein